nr:PREDICTED: mitochondrial ribonuclease P protein 3 [Bemisia tabaci]XP_018896209.1 PREDICTED: mitochondrial ribonuclease P protein 3 [Bemisia tabaci]
MERTCHSVFKVTNMATKNFLRKGLTSAFVSIQRRNLTELGQTPSEDDASPKETGPIRLLRNRLSEEFSKNKSVDWNSIQEEALQLVKFGNQRNISVRILQVCGQLQDFDAGKAFLSHLKSSGSPLTVGVILSYFKLCNNFKHCLTEDDLQELSNMCNIVQTKYHMFLHGKFINDFILGLALTNRLEEGLKYLEVCKDDSHASTVSYAALIETAASLKKFDVALKLFEDGYECDRDIQSKTIVVFITQCSDAGKASYIESLLHIMNRHMIIPEACFAEKLVELSSSELFPFKGSITSISNGWCQHCSQALTKIKITQKEYENLKVALISDSLIGGDIFKKTNPKELKNFLSFIRRTSPYDIVVDGLNVMYLVKPDGPRHFKSRSLKMVVHPLVSQNKKILVLLRNHMKSYKDPDMNFVTSHCNIFFVDNESSDDNYLLYAALYNPLGTCFISKDFMRGHKSSLSTTELRKTFKLWQQSHQIVPYRIGYETGLQYPVEHFLIPHKSQEGTWHIPFSTSGRINYEHDHFYINLPELEQRKTFSWLCLKPRNESDVK